MAELSLYTIFSLVLHLHFVLYTLSYNLKSRCGGRREVPPFRLFIVGLSIFQKHKKSDGKLKTQTYLLQIYFIVHFSPQYFLLHVFCAQLCYGIEREMHPEDAFLHCLLIFRKAKMFYYYLETDRRVFSPHASDVQLLCHSSS